MSTIQDIYEEYQISARAAKTKAQPIKLYSSHSSNNSIYFNSSKQGGFSSSTNYYNGLPKEAVFKVLNAGKKLKGRSVKNAIDYIARETLEFEKEFEETQDKSNYKLALENQDGEFINSKDEISELYEQWSETFSKNSNGVDAEHLLFSTAEKPNKKTNHQILAAARETLKKEFGDKGYDYVFVMHTDKDHTHVHAIVRKYNTRSQQTLKLEKKDLWNIRKTWANELTVNGLHYEVSINMERIKSMTHKLEYVETNNLSWFQHKVKTLNSENANDLLKELETTQTIIKKLELQRDTLKQTQKNIFYDVSQKELNRTIKKELETINKTISNHYTTSRAIIKKLNDLNFQVAAAAKAYEKLQSNKEKITGVLKLSSTYRNLEKQAKAAYEMMMSKKFDLDKAQVYISKLNSSKNYNINTNTELSYSFDNLKSIITNYERTNNTRLILAAQKEIAKIQNSLNMSTTYLNKNTAKELKNLIKEFNTNNVLPRYQQEIKNTLLNDLANDNKVSKNLYDSSILTHDDFIGRKKHVDSLINDINNNYDISINKLKKLGIDISKYSTKQSSFTINGLNLNDASKTIILKELGQLKNTPVFAKDKLLSNTLKQIEKSNIVYEYQLKKLDLNSDTVLNKLGQKQFDKIEMYHEVIDTEKTYINWFNNDYIHIEKSKNIDYQIEFSNLQKLDTSSMSSDAKNDYLERIDSIKYSAIKNHDLNTFDAANKIDMVDKNLTIKAYGELLQIKASDINREIWNDIIQEDLKHYDKSILTSEHNQSLYNYDYQTEFFERYIDRLKLEYSMQKEMPGEQAHEIEHEKYFKEIEAFDNFCNTYKEEHYQSINYENQINDIKELLENGQFKSADNELKSLDKLDQDYLNVYREYYIDEYSHGLDHIKENIDLQSNLERDAYLADKDDSIYKQPKETVQHDHTHKHDYKKSEEPMNENIKYSIIKEIAPQEIREELQIQINNKINDINSLKNRSKELSNKIAEMGEEGSLQKLNISEKEADRLEIQYNIEINEISYKVEKLQNELSHLQPEDLGNKKINEVTPDELPKELIEHISNMSHEEKQLIKQQDMTVNETIEYINNEHENIDNIKEDFHQIQKETVQHDHTQEQTIKDMIQPKLNFEKETLHKKDNKVKLDHEKLKQEQQQKTKELFSKIKSIIENKEVKENKRINSYTLSKKEDVLKISNRLITNLNQNYYDIKNTQEFIKNLDKNSKSYKNDLAALDNSVNHYKEISQEINKNVNEFISNVQNSKLSKADKLEILHTTFEKLEDKKYHENILNITDDKAIKEEVTKRDIEHIKTITKKMEQLSNGHKIIDKKLLDTSKAVSNRLDNQKLSITQSMRLKNIKKKQNELTNRNLGQSLQL